MEQNLQTITNVQFMDTTLHVVQAEGCDYVALKPISDRFGLQWSRQYARVHNNAVFRDACYIWHMPSETRGDQQTLCLRVD